MRIFHFPKYTIFAPLSINNKALQIALNNKKKLINTCYHMEWKS